MSLLSFFYQDTYEFSGEEVWGRFLLSYDNGELTREAEVVVDGETVLDYQETADVPDDGGIALHLSVKSISFGTGDLFDF